MRTLQFWILVVCSSLVSVLMIVQIFLSHSLNKELQVFSETQSIASTGPGYENAWKQFAMHIYQASHSGQDVALLQVLKDANIGVRATPANPAPPTPQTAPSAATNSVQAPIAPNQTNAP